MLTLKMSKTLLLQGSKDALYWKMMMQSGCSTASVLECKIQFIGVFSHVKTTSTPLACVPSYGR